MASNYKVTTLYTLTSPLSHIGETASIGTIFQTLQTPSGRIPVVTGNSIRGQLRDLGAEYLLDACGLKVDKPVFNALFSGGNLSGASKHDLARARAIREKLPFASLFGCGIGSMLLAGKMQVGFAYPVCKETEFITGIVSDKSWREMIDEMEMTRMDDSKDSVLAAQYIEGWNPDDAPKKKAGEASTQMRFSVQYLAPGTQLWQEITFSPAVTDAEMGAFLTAWDAFSDRGIMGGMSAKGFGRFTAERTIAWDLTEAVGKDCIAVYDAIAKATTAKDLALLVG